MRLCLIESASVEDALGRGDGAYSLLEVVGSPEDIGKAIAESLHHDDLFSGDQPSSLDAGEDLYLNVRIRFCNPDKVLKSIPEGWHDSGEGPFENAMEAGRFASAEVGVAWKLFRDGSTVRVLLSDSPYPP